jgi:hypothetical protein
MQRFTAFEQKTNCNAKICSIWTKNKFVNGLWNKHTA